MTDLVERARMMAIGKDITGEGGERLCHDLANEIERLRALLLSASRHVMSEGDDMLLTLINEALEAGVRRSIGGSR